MKFDFKNSDFVTCRVLRDTVISLEPVKAGMVVRIDGWTAKTLMGGSVPAVELVGDGSPEEPKAPEKIQVLDDEPVRTREPKVETRDPDIEFSPAPKRASGRPRKAS